MLVKEKKLSFFYHISRPIQSWYIKNKNRLSHYLLLIILFPKTTMLLVCTIQYYHGNRNHCVLSNVATGQRGIEFRWFRRNCHPWTSIVFTFSLQSFSGNLTKEKVSVKGEKAQGKGPRSNQRQEKKKRLSVLEPSLQKNVAAAFAHTEVH